MKPCAFSALMALVVIGCSSDIREGNSSEESSGKGISSNKRLTNQEKGVLDKDLPEDLVDQVSNASSKDVSEEHVEKVSNNSPEKALSQEQANQLSKHLDQVSHNSPEKALSQEQANSQSVNKAETPPSQTFVAFGDWGFVGKTGLQKINTVAVYLGLLDQADELDGVILLGDNFYYHGAMNVNDPIFKRFTEHLAVTTRPEKVKFYALMGNHDADGNVEAQVMFQHPQWITESGNYFRKFSSDDKLITCVWFVHYHLAKTSKEQIDTMIDENKSDCTWRILATHVPIITAGMYILDPEVARMNTDYQDIIKKHKIHAYMCGHEHTSQYLIHPEVPETKVFVAGEVAWDRDEENRITKTDPRLQWYDATHFPSVMKIRVTKEKLSFDFVDLSSPDQIPRVMTTVDIQ